jgi:transposase
MTSPIGKQNVAQHACSVGGPHEQGGEQVNTGVPRPNNKSARRAGADGADRAVTAACRKPGWPWPIAWR